MKLQNIPFLLVAVFLVLVSCKGGEKKQPEAASGETAFEQQVSGQDTAAVEALVDRFFGYVMDKQYAEAAAMLYRNDMDDDQTPVELDNEEIREFGIKKVGKKLVISPVFCIFIVENQNTTKRTSDDYQGQSYRDFLYY